MKTRERSTNLWVILPDTYQDAPFRDATGKLVRVKVVFVWTYEREGLLCLNGHRRRVRLGV